MVSTIWEIDWTHVHRHLQNLPYLDLYLEKPVPEHPGNEKLKQVEQLQQSITAQYLELDTMQQAISGISSSIDTGPDEELSIFDDLDKDNEDTPSALPVPAPLQYHIPCMLSTCENPKPKYHCIEMALRKHQATRHLHHLHEATADKSFQYSHVIHVAPWKTVCNQVL